MVRCSLFAVRCVLFVVFCLQGVVCGRCAVSCVTVCVVRAVRGVRCLWFVVLRLLYVGCRLFCCCLLLTVFGGLLFVVCCVVCVVGWRLLFGVCCVYCLSFVVCYLLFVVGFVDLSWCSLSAACCVFLLFICSLLCGRCRLMFIARCVLNVARCL